MSYCTNCGKQQSEGAKFCDSCGTKVQSYDAIETVEVKKTTFEGNVYKCPSCGEVINHDTLICPSCNHQIRGRLVSNSIQIFSEKISLQNDERIKIELIKTFPIPNNREDIIEFMFLASSNFDARHYATNKATDSVSGAWLSKIDQCYKKGKIMFTNQGDLIAIESIYNEVHAKTKSVEKSKLIMTICGIALTVLALVLIVAFGQSVPSLGYLFIAMLVIGILLIVKGLRKNKTNAQMEDDENIKRHKKLSKNNQQYETDYQAVDVQHHNEKPFRHNVFTSSGRVVNKNIYVFLAIVFGWLGVHKRYAGYRIAAWIYMFTLGLFGIGWFIDIFKAIGQRSDTRGNIVV